MANERLRDALLRNGLTPDQVARAVDVDPKTVERWITKGRAPYPKHRHAIAAMVKESENYLWPAAILTFFALAATPVLRAPPTSKKAAPAKTAPVQARKSKR